MCTQGHADSEFAGAPAYRKSQHARHSNHRNQKSQGSESTEYDGIEAVRRHDLGAHIVQGGGPLHRLVHSHLMDRARDGRNQRVRVILRADEKTAAPAFLVGGLIHRHSGRRDDVFIVNVGHHADDAPWLGADADELHHRVCPLQVAVHGVASGK